VVVGNGNRKEDRNVPLHLPPLLGLLRLKAGGYRLEWDGRKNCSSDLMWCRQMFSIEFCQAFGCMDIHSVFPSIVFHAVAFPLDEEPQSSLEHLTVQYFFNQIFLFSLYKFRWRWCKGTVSLEASDLSEPVVRRKSLSLRSD